MLTFFTIILILFDSTLCFEDREKLIVGGKLAKIEDYPHSAFIVTKWMIEGTEVMEGCGGCILTQYVVLTSANCLTKCRRMGKNCTLQAQAYVGHATKFEGTVYHAKSYSFHSKYLTSKDYLSYDIGMLFMYTEIQFNTFVKRVILTQRRPNNATYGYVAGWGHVNAEGEASKYLKKLKLQIRERNNCKIFLAKMPKKALCGGHPNSTNFLYTGDTGSALVTEDYILIGLASYLNIKEAQGIGVFVDTSLKYRWIMRTADLLSCTNGTKAEAKQKMLSEYATESFTTTSTILMEGNVGPPTDVNAIEITPMMWPTDTRNYETTDNY